MTQNQIILAFIQKTETSYNDYKNIRTTVNSITGGLADNNPQVIEAHQKWVKWTNALECLQEVFENNKPVFIEEEFEIIHD